MGRNWNEVIYGFSAMVTGEIWKASTTTFITNRFIITYPWHHSAVETRQLGTVVGNLFLHHPEKASDKVRFRRCKLFSLHNIMAWCMVSGTAGWRKEAWTQHQGFTLVIKKKSLTAGELNSLHYWHIILNTLGYDNNMTAHHQRLGLILKCS